MEWSHIFVALVLLFILYRQWRIQSGVTRDPPDPPYPQPLLDPLTPADPPLTRTSIPQLTRPLPDFKDGLVASLKAFEFWTKEKEVKDHLAYLEERKTAIDAPYGAAVACYQAARRHVVAQRDALRITLKHAKHLSEGLSFAQSQRSDIQQPAAIRIPPAPLYETPAALQAKYSHILDAAGRGSAKAIQQGGGIVGLAVVTVASTAAMIATFQRSLRKLVESDQAMRLFAQRAADTVDLLGRSYAELLGSSAAIHAKDCEMRALIDRITASGAIMRYRSGSSSSNEQGWIQTLIANSMIADAYVAMGD